MTWLSRAFMYGLVLAVEVFMLFFAWGAPWRGEWNWTFDFAVGTTALTGPLIGACAGWVCAGERRRGTLVDSTWRGWLAPVRSAATAAAVGLAAWTTGLAVVVVATATVPHGGPVEWWVLLKAVPLLGAHAILGAVVGHLWPQRVLVVLVAPALFLVGGLSEFGIGPAVLRHVPTSASLAGQSFDVGVLIREALVLVGVVTLVVAAQAVRRRVRVPVASVVAAGSLVVAGVAASGLSADMDSRLRLSDERPTVCAGERPRVCVLPSNRRSLDPVRRQLHRVAKPLIDAGAPVPDTYVAAGPARSAPSGSGDIALPAEANLSSYRLFEAALQIATPEPCPAWSAEIAPPEAAFEARHLVSAWVMAQFGDLGLAFSEGAERWLREAPAGEQAEVVVALFENLRACRLNDLVLPWQR